jgi:hypothetical protein
MFARTGVARLALAADVPVIPVGQWGAQHAVDVYHKKVRLLPRKKVHCLAGPPVDLSAYRGRPVTVELLREVTDAIMRDVQALVGELRGETPPADFWRPARAPKPETPAAAAQAAELAAAAPAELAGTEPAEPPVEAPAGPSVEAPAEPLAEAPAGPPSVEAPAAGADGDAAKPAGREAAS